MLRFVLRKLNISLPPMPTSPPLHEPDRITLLQLAAIISLAVATHFSIANPLVGLFALVVFVLKVTIVWQSKPAPPRWVMAVLTVASLGVILFFYGGWNGQTAGISFLVLLVTLKFMESRSLRDYYVVCLILYFLAASSFLFNSSIITIVIVIAYTIAITAVLFKISTPSRVRWQRAIKSSCSIVIKAVPLAVFLFFFFPRIQADFGFIPSQDEGTRQLENRLIAGEMAASAFDNSLAFRVSFDGDIPTNEQLYWRSKVMTLEEDFQWQVVTPTPGELKSAETKRAQLSLDKGQVSYEVLHEQSGDLFIPYLDYVAGFNKGEILDDYSVYVRNKSVTTFSYKGSSTFRPSLPVSDRINHVKLTTTKSQPSAKMQALLSQWRAENDSPQAIVESVYHYFTEQPFAYSLLPPPLDQDRPLEDFIFTTQTGYCEHYASAFSTIMRWLGIPARVVVGFQGGDLNQSGNYLEVRYSDAHAWSEVFINGQWQRVDATAAVSPERIEFGMDALQSLWDGNSLGSNASGRALASYLNPTGVNRTLRWLNDNWKNVGYQWNKWIVNYDVDTQRELLSRLGLEHRNTLSTLVGILIFGSFALLLLYFWQLLPKARKLDEAQKLYLKFTDRFKRYGVEKDLSDTPNDFANKLIARFPESSTNIRNVTNTYQALRYGQNKSSEDALSAFKQSLKQFTLETQATSQVATQETTIETT